MKKVLTIQEAEELLAEVIEIQGMLRTVNSLEADDEATLEEEAQTKSDNIVITLTDKILEAKEEKNGNDR